jgi:hypothetical protein
MGAPGNGQWIYLFRPKNGAINAEKLVNLTSHEYSLEPNVTFTRDRKWIVFRSNLFGETHVYRSRSINGDTRDKHAKRKRDGAKELESS